MVLQSTAFCCCCCCCCITSAVRSVLTRLGQTVKSHTGIMNCHGRSVTGPAPQAVANSARWDKQHSKSVQHKRHDYMMSQHMQQASPTLLPLLLLLLQVTLQPTQGTWTYATPPQVTELTATVTYNAVSRALDFLLPNIAAAGIYRWWADYTNPQDGVERQRIRLSG